MKHERRRELYTAVDRFLEFPMLCLALVFIPILIVPWIFELNSTWESALEAANWTIWVFFALELVVKLYLAPARLAYLREHWFDVVVVVLPFARPLRIAQSARVLRIARLARLISAAFRASHSLRAMTEQHGLHYFLAVSILLVVASAGAITIVERDGGGNIRNFGDGLWWAATTVTTVGYGDRFPVTVEGRAIAVFLMLLGISIFSYLTANIAAFLSRTPASDEPTLQDVMDRLQQLETLIRERSSV